MQSTGHVASIDQKISGVSRLLNAKFLVHCGDAAAIFGSACPPAWRRSINVPTMTEMSTELEATNPTGRKGRQARACPA